ncbi:MAG: DUF3196 domain-containing protein [Solobacterium sp.]|nr:DUF3196 domain-containing protein [Solobacterium sp.]
MSYYDDVLEEISRALKNNELDEADYLIRKELSMPYIPADAEQRLFAMKKEIQFRKAEKRENTEESLDALLRKLKGRPQSQLTAAEKLCDRNLRACTDEIRDWLSKDPLPEAAAFIINALAEQEIQDEFVYVKQGVEYSFSGDSVTPVARSEGFLYACSYLENWLGSNPALLEMAKTLLISDAYMYLPLSYEKEEAEIIAYQKAKEICSMMDDQETMKEVENRRSETAAKIKKLS